MFSKAADSRDKMSSITFVVDDFSRRRLFVIDGCFDTDTYFVLLMSKSSGLLNLVNVFSFEK